MSRRMAHRRGLVSQVCAVAVGIALLGGCTMSAPSNAVGPLSRIAAAVREARAAQAIPGIAVALAIDGHVYALQAGQADVGRRSTAADTVFALGSLTKAITAAAVLSLIAERKVALQDRLSRYVPEYRFARSLTIEQLLEQTAGVPNYLAQPAFAAAIERGEQPDPLAQLNAMALESTPGKAFRYSNGNYFLLSRVVARRSAEPFERYVMDRVILPLGLKNTFADNRTIPISQAALGYTRDDARTIVTPSPPSGLLDGAANMWSSASDVVHWDRAFFEGAVVPPGLVAVSMHDHQLPGGATNRYVMGWLHAGAPGAEYWWHEGRTPGFSSANIAIPRRHLYLAVLTNSDQVRSTEIAEHILATIAPQAPASAAPHLDARTKAKAEAWLQRVAANDLDRSQMTEELRNAFNPITAGLFSMQLRSLGRFRRLALYRVVKQHDSTIYQFNALFDGGSMRYWFGVSDDGKVSTIAFNP